MSVIPQSEDGPEASPMDWSGPVGLGNIGTFPICIRPKPGGAALPGESLYVESRASDAIADANCCLMGKFRFPSKSLNERYLVSWRVQYQTPLGFFLLFS